MSAALLYAALAASPLQSQQIAADAANADARAVLGAVLAHQASIRGPESGAETCVAQALVGPPVAPGVAAEDDPMQPDHSVRIYFQWHVPDAPPPVRPLPPLDPGQNGRRNRNRQRAAPPPPPPAALDQAAAERLNALRTQAAHGSGGPATAQIDASLIAAPLRLQRPNDDCDVLTLSAPAFAGDAAFVEYAYSCGTVCGNGGLYALERRDGRWQPVGIADIWIR